MMFNFERGPKDKDKDAKGKEGSKKEAFFDKNKFKKKFAQGGEVRGCGAATKGKHFGGMTGMKKGGAC